VQGKNRTTTQRAINASTIYRQNIDESGNGRTGESYKKSGAIFLSNASLGMNAKSGSY
jgi:hypothetical protein